MFPKWRRALASRLNQKGAAAADLGACSQAVRYYSWASKLDPEWAVPFYNLGLRAKYGGDWKASRQFNQRAALLDPDDEAAWWNLGIAATALGDWKEARRAWKTIGIELSGDEGECAIVACTACVRIEPANCGEVVWGERIDPARFVILNVPLPESGRRFRDVLLNDGAPNGTRVKDGVEVPVFDELEVWRPSQYSTFEVVLEGVTAEAEESLVELCNERELGVEDWSTIRFICQECSRGNPGPHDCKRLDTDAAERTYAIAAQSESEVMQLLTEWQASTSGRSCLSIETMLRA